MSIVANFYNDDPIRQTSKAFIDHRRMRFDCSGQVSAGGTGHERRGEPRLTAA
jgi:hypothetical protein